MATRRKPSASFAATWPAISTGSWGFSRVLEDLKHGVIEARDGNARDWLDEHSYGSQGPAAALHAQLQTLGQGRCRVKAALEAGQIDDPCDWLRRVLVELDRWDPTIYQLTAQVLGRQIDLRQEDARKARGQSLRVLDSGRE